MHIKSIFAIVGLLNQQHDKISLFILLEITAAFFTMPLLTNLINHLYESVLPFGKRTTANIYAHLDYSSKITSAQAMETGLALPESGDFGSDGRILKMVENK